MISLLLVIFLLQVVIHLVNSVGASTVDELLWIAYNKLPTPTSAAVAQSTRQKREVMRMKRELNAVSAQDDFAKWAKLRRQHDKAVADYEKSSAALTASKSKFDKVAKGARWISTNGLRYFLQFWFSKQPMFWVPSGWVPGYIEWLLAFPRAPTGCVSIQVWGIACGSVVKLVSEAVVAGFKLTEERKSGGQRQAQAFTAADMQRTPGSGTATPKKEL